MMKKSIMKTVIKKSDLKCDSCNSNLEFIYTPIKSIRGLKVYSCINCNLMQSLPRIDHYPRDRKRRASSEADWGNIRYGKIFRTDFAIRKIKEYSKSHKIKNILDVGSSRGSFIEKFIEEGFEKANFFAVEPDTSVSNSFDELSNVTFLGKRIEKCSFNKDYFDLIYSSHTLEHLRSPASHLDFCNEVLNEEGFVFLEVPNSLSIQRGDSLEEFFIDKHLYHFTPCSLKALIESKGFHIWMIESDAANISVVFGRKKKKTQYKIEKEPSSIELISSYKKNKKHMAEAFKIKAQRFNKMMKEGNQIAFWGAGRIFDQLVKNGLEIENIAKLIDKNLWKYLKDSNGMKIQNSENINLDGLDHIVVTSREFFDEISQEIKKLDPSMSVSSVFK